MSLIQMQIRKYLILIEDFYHWFDMKEIYTLPEPKADQAKFSGLDIFFIRDSRGSFLFICIQYLQ